MAPPDLTGLVLDQRYRVARLLGRGAFGAVYQGVHEKLGGPVAIKVLQPSYAHGDDFSRRFRREAAALSHLRHPHIVEVLDFGEQKGIEYLVLEYLDGRELSAVIGNGPLRWERAVAIARQIALALAGAHRIGVVHRDLKPGNIMLIDLPGRPDHIKVLDFGIAKIVDPKHGMGAEMDSLTQAGVAMGTPNYMAPEMWREEKVDGRADLYALGVLLFEMVTGRPPFHAPTTFEIMGRHLNADIPPLAPVRQGTHPPEDLEALIRQMLAKNKADRPARAEDLIRDLELVGSPTGRYPLSSGNTDETIRPRDTGANALGGYADAGGPMSMELRPPAPLRRRQLPTLLVAAVAALAGIGVWELWGEQGKRWASELNEGHRLERLLTAPAEAGATVVAPASRDAASRPGDGGAADAPAEERVLPGLELVSDPSGAEVIFDGRSLGRTPLNLKPDATAEALMDKARYQLKLDGYEVQDLIQRTEPLPTGPIVVGTAVLEPVPGPADAAGIDAPAPTPAAAVVARSTRRARPKPRDKPRAKAAARAAPEPGARVATTIVAKPTPKPPPEPPPAEASERASGVAAAAAPKIALPAKRNAAQPSPAPIAPAPTAPAARSPGPAKPAAATVDMDE